MLKNRLGSLTSDRNFLLCRFSSENFYQGYFTGWRIETKMGDTGNPYTAHVISQSVSEGGREGGSEWVSDNKNN